MSTSLDGLIPELQGPAADLINLAGAAGVQPRVTSTLRSHSEQVRLYNRYLAGRSAYPVAPPGRSAHEFGYAFDMIVAGSDNQHDLGTVWQAWGGVYSLHDDIHFEYPGFTPPAYGQEPSQGALEQFVNLAAGFLPGVSLAQLSADIAQWLGLQGSRATYWIANPFSGVTRFLRDYVVDPILTGKFEGQ